jgi:hypothetical protein
MTRTSLYQRHPMAFGLPAYLGMLGVDPAALDRAQQRLVGLERIWGRVGSGSELARLRACPGVAIRVCPDTVLLARIYVSQCRFRPSFYVDQAHQLVGLLGDTPANLDQLLVPVAAELVLAELTAGGPAGACVRIGPTVRSTGACPSPNGWAGAAGRILCDSSRQAA